METRRKNMENGNMKTKKRRMKTKVHENDDGEEKDDNRRRQ